jgi:uncharacterized iron-regulated membrane protein
VLPVGYTSITHNLKKKKKRERREIKDWHRYTGGWVVLSLLAFPFLKGKYVCNKALESFLQVTTGKDTFYCNATANYKQHTTTAVNPAKAGVNIQQWLTNYRKQSGKIRWKPDRAMVEIQLLTVIHK